MKAPIPADEELRLERLLSYDVLDTPSEEAFDRITRIISQTIGVPISLVSLVDRDRQWFKSAHGLDKQQTERDIAFCAHAILSNEVLVVEDATLDARFQDNPLVMAEPKIRFYAGAPLITTDGHNLGTLCAIDLTPRELSPEHEQLLQDMAAFVIDELELRIALRRALEDKAEANHLQLMQSKFLSLVSHELRTPLTSIQGTLKLIQGGVTGAVSEQTQKLVDIANRNTASLLNLVNDLLDVQKINAGKFDFAFSITTVEDIVSTVMDSVQGSANAKDIALDVSIGDDIPAILADPVRLRQALVNLTSNAIKAEPKGGTVEVSVACAQDRITFSVTDHGPGIPKDFHNKMFDCFAQAEGENKAKGTGLGLTICKSIVEAHNGHIHFDTDPNAGTRFHLSIPAKQSISTVSSALAEDL